jgi:hypothetical protein
MSTKDATRRDRNRRKWAAVGAGLAGLVVVTTLAWLAVLHTRAAPTAVDSARAGSGWGHESVAALKYVARLSPIADANACGLGASSCFKCHNGMRAMAPKMDAKTAPWHWNHRSVNGDCVGCHKGNERLIKKEFAHKGLIADPRKSVADSCSNCHKSGNAAELNKKYES